MDLWRNLKAHTFTTLVRVTYPTGTLILLLCITVLQIVIPPPAAVIFHEFPDNS